MTLAFSSPRKINRVEDITFRYPSFILPRIEQLQLQLLPFWPAFFRPSFLDRNLVFSHPSPLLSLRFSRPRAPPQSSSPEATAVVTTAIWWVFPLKGHTWLLFALAFSNHPGQILLFVVQNRAHIVITSFRGPSPGQDSAKSFHLTRTYCRFPPKLRRPQLGRLIENWCRQTVLFLYVIARFFQIFDHRTEYRRTNQQFSFLPQREFSV